MYIAQYVCRLPTYLIESEMANPTRDFQESGFFPTIRGKSEVGKTAFRKPSYCIVTGLTVLLLTSSIKNALMSFFITWAFLRGVLSKPTDSIFLILKNPSQHFGVKDTEEAPYLRTQLLKFLATSRYTGNQNSDSYVNRGHFKSV